MRGIADGRDEPVPSTIEDPAVLDALRPFLTAGGEERNLVGDVEIFPLTPTDG